MSKNNSGKINLDDFKQYFDKQTTLNVNDIIDFSKKFDKTFDQNEAKAYLDKLVDMKIVRHKSREVYAIEHLNQKENEYYVLLMDVIGSSSYDFVEFNKQLKEKIVDLNISLEKLEISKRKYYISQGDGIQILIPKSNDLTRLLLLTFAYLSPYKVSYGISLGTYDEELLENSWEMNGPIFWNARDGLNQIKKNNDYVGAIRTEYREKDEICNKLLPLVNKQIERISEKQWEAIKCKLLGFSVEEAAVKLSISKASYYDRIDKSNYKELKNALDGLVGIVNI